MRYTEIFQNSDAVFYEDATSAIEQADQAIISAKKNKKTLEISALRDKAADKQRELASMGSGIKPIKPIKPIKQNEVK